MYEWYTTKHENAPFSEEKAPREDHEGQSDDCARPLAKPTSPLKACDLSPNVSVYYCANSLPHYSLESLVSSSQRASEL